MSKGVFSQQATLLPLKIHVLLVSCRRLALAWSGWRPVWWYERKRDKDGRQSKTDFRESWPRTPKRGQWKWGIFFSSCRLGLPKEWALPKTHFCRSPCCSSSFAWDVGSVGSGSFLPYMEGPSHHPGRLRRHGPCPLPSLPPIHTLNIPVIS